MINLFSPIQLGSLKLKNRIIMAPLTRCRAGVNRVPTPLMVEYYTQRASAGLIISEATSISPMAVGYPDTPGIWSQEQIEGWQSVTNSVHQAGGKIVLQLWHVGRLSDPSFLNGAKPVSASAIAADGHPSHVRPIKPYDVPHALNIDEIQQIILDYRQAAINAKHAGFDGVEIHGANGYLLDQFLQDNSNLRTDCYGGSLENRARLLLEVTKTVCEVWGADRVGVHLAPRCDAQSMGDSNPLATFSYVARELAKLNLAFIFSRALIGEDNLAAKLKQEFGGNYIINQNLSQADANLAIQQGYADAAAWGQLFIANPDLVTRFLNNTKLNQANPETFYTGGSKGYTDYPALD
ncbi:MAG: alkene reductase [Burkholderiales bacterium]|nr:alkene reductase [Burkholderiales bacterium]